MLFPSFLFLVQNEMEIQITNKITENVLIDKQNYWNKLTCCLGNGCLFIQNDKQDDLVDKCRFYISRLQLMTPLTVHLIFISLFYITNENGNVKSVYFDENHKINSV